MRFGLALGGGLSPHVVFPFPCFKLYVGYVYGNHEKEISPKYCTKYFLIQLTKTQHTVLYVCLYTTCGLNQYVYAATATGTGCLMPLTLTLSPRLSDRGDWVAYSVWALAESPGYAPRLGKMAVAQAVCYCATSFVLKVRGQLCVTARRC